MNLILTFNVITRAEDVAMMGLTVMKVEAAQNRREPARLPRPSMQEGADI